VGRTPTQLFTDYLAEQRIDDARVGRLFADLLDEVTGLPTEPPERDEPRPAEAGEPVGARAATGRG
jgi:hypothetical protein